MTAIIAADIRQQLFRVLLTAMSNPGRVCPVNISAINGLTRGLLTATAQCLMDHEVSFAVASPDHTDLADEISRSTGAFIVEPRKADYLFVMDAFSNGLAARAKRGTLEYPDTGATIIYQLPSFSEGLAGAGSENQGVTFSGPGIRATRSPDIAGLDKRELMLLDQVNHEYPLGVDAFFFFGNQAVMGLPRSTRIEVI